MKRQINNLLFLSAFLIAFIVGNTNYVNFCMYLYDKAILVLNQHEDNNKIIHEQNDYKRALPSQAYLDARISFIEGRYINKAYARQRVEVMPTHRGIIKSSTANYGRDGP